MSVTAQHGDLWAGERTVITGDKITVREAAQVVAVREQFRVEGFLQDLRESHAVVCLIGAGDALVHRTVAAVDLHAAECPTLAQ